MPGRILGGERYENLSSQNNSQKPEDKWHQKDLSSSESDL